MIRQTEASECGLACLAMAAGYHGLHTDLLALRRRHQTSLKGITLKQLLQVAEHMHLSARPVRCDIETMNHLALPAVLHWNFNHFVVLTKFSRRLGKLRYHINDPASGRLEVGNEEMRERFTGVALEIRPLISFQPSSDRIRLKLNQLWARLEGFWPTVRQVLVLSILLQLFALVGPLFLQISIDNVLPAADERLLYVLLIGFLGLVLISTLTSWVRALVLVRMSSSLSYQVTLNLFRHLLRLPLPWFERRHVGDVVSRFGSTKPVSDLLSQGLIASVIDGVMAILTLALMFMYSPALASLALVAVIVTGALKFGFFSALRQANVNAIVAIANESSAFIESIRGAATIKAFGEEGNREQLWQKKKADAVNAEMKAGRLNAAFSAGQELALGIERILFVYIAIGFAIKGGLSLGMVFALQSYRQHFLSAATNLLQQAVSYRLLDMHLSRIGDIALSTPENLVEVPSLVPTESGQAATLELRNVRFRYGPHDAEVIKGISLKISAGEMIALVGPSGGGKTTLLKILMGLLEPTSGEVLVNGQSLASYGLGRWRREVASVAQDDALFAGTLADNISFFDPEPDGARITQAAQLASIDQDIERMPMQYYTAVGDMGSVLSGGQKQRVVLARALYRNPTALFLDEATAHLDPESEQRVGQAILELTCTRIIVAHRPETIKRANRRFYIEDGQIVPPERISGMTVHEGVVRKAS
ncbi:MULTISPECIES: peptidase domain-containing ABC transporter [unclassified Sphingomonas]|nr:MULTISPECIES: peptidase domain-containing ABC transporter [unclassified Sphingomonas]